MSNINITISAPTGMGRSTIAEAISDALLAQGLSVTVDYGPEGRPFDRKEKLDERVAAIASNGTTVTIKTLQVARLMLVEGASES